MAESFALATAATVARGRGIYARDHAIYAPTAAAPQALVLWPHQAAAVAAVREAFRRVRRVLYVLPTGGGKTEPPRDSRRRFCLSQAAMA